jgi:hypothetical protein
MNVFKKALVALALFAATFSASAIEVSFDFSVFSSGSSIYPCNAGIKQANTNVQVCYKRTEPTTTCNPSACVEGEQCDCVCSGTSGGAYNVNFLTAGYTAWTDHNESAGSSTSSSVKSTTSENFVFGNNTDLAGQEAGKYFDNQLTSLSFNLGSELFGAEYYLDVCFRGPQIDYATAGIHTNWVANASATIQNMAGYANYQDVAGLTVKSEIVCDYQEVNAPNAVNFTPGNDALDYTAETLISLEAFNGSETVNGGKNITEAGGIAPTFCRVRYTFKEGNLLEGRELFRPWKKQAAKVCTKTSIEEP